MQQAGVVLQRGFGTRIQAVRLQFINFTGAAFAGNPTMARIIVALGALVLAAGLMLNCPAQALDGYGVDRHFGSAGHVGGGYGSFAHWRNYAAWAWDSGSPGYFYDRHYGSGANYWIECSEASGNATWLTQPMQYAKFRARFCP
jgi:hypothetical protein